MRSRQLRNATEARRNVALKCVPLDYLIRKERYGLLFSADADLWRKTRSAYVGATPRGAAAPIVIATMTET